MIDKETGEIIRPFVRDPYNYDVDQASHESGLECCDPTKAQQQFREETDINTIVKNFGLTGEMPENVKVPHYGDYSSVVDYKTAVDMVLAAEESFMELPAQVRARFNNDPQALMEFVHDEVNSAEAEKLGLVSRPAAPLPIPVIVQQPPEGDTKGVT